MHLLASRQQHYAQKKPLFRGATRCPHPALTKEQHVMHNPLVARRLDANELQRLIWYVDCRAQVGVVFSHLVRRKNHRQGEVTTGRYGGGRRGACAACFCQRRQGGEQ